MSDERYGPTGADPEGEALTDELRDLFARVDGVPEHVTAAAKATLGWRRIDADLAQLLYDSAMDDARLATARSARSARALTFEGAGLVVEVEVEDVDGRLRLTGQLVPPAPGTVDVRHREGVAQVEADALGRFVVDDVPSGPASFRCRVDAAGGASIETEWVTL